MDPDATKGGLATTTEFADTERAVSALRAKPRHAPESSVTARVTSRGLLVPPELDFEGWAAVGSRIAGIATACAWCLGDWLVFGQRAYGDRYRTALAATSLEYQTLRNYAWVAGRIPMSRRRDTLSFQHHAEVVALPDPEQDLWLLRAERLGWSRNELRRRLRAARALCAGGDERMAIVLRVQVAPDREERWRRAADALEEHLAEWVSRAADAAADAVLGPGPHLDHGEEPRTFGTP